MESKPAIWTIKNPEGLYCSNCGQQLEDWIAWSSKQKSAWKQWSEKYK